MRSYVYSICKPKSSNEDLKRQEYILNIILFVSIIIFSLFDLIILRNSIAKGMKYDGIEFILFTAIIIFYIVLLLLSKKRFIKCASYGLILFYMAGALYCGYKWGASLPATILTFTLVIIISSILINSKFGIRVTAIALISFTLLGIHEYSHPEILHWKLELINNTDFITYSLMLSFIAMLSWLSNREIEKSLERARKSEKELRIERDSLEIKVIERTKELKNIQIKRMEELEKVAEFGRQSRGLFHDLLSPLNSMVLHMKKIKGMTTEEIAQTDASLDKIIQASHKINDNVQRLRCSMKNSMPDKLCDINDELENCIYLLQFKTRENNTIINITRNDLCEWRGDPIKLHQIFLNIISNAIDACSSIKNKERKIDINIKKDNKYCIVSIEDNGIGIDNNMLDQIFDPFYTTKSPEHGTGIGLTTVKKIIEEIGGKITVKSIKNIGSEFIVTIPNYKLD